MTKFSARHLIAAKIVSAIISTTLVATRSIASLQKNLDNNQHHLGGNAMNRVAAKIVLTTNHDEKFLGEFIYTLVKKQTLL